MNQLSSSHGKVYRYLLLLQIDTLQNPFDEIPFELQPPYNHTVSGTGFKGVLSDEEFLASLSYIKSTWPKEVQKRHDEINARVPR